MRGRDERRVTSDEGRNPSASASWYGDVDNSKEASAAWYGDVDNSKEASASWYGDADNSKEASAAWYGDVDNSKEASALPDTDVIGSDTASAVPDPDVIGNETASAAPDTDVFRFQRNMRSVAMSVVMTVLSVCMGALLPAKAQSPIRTALDSTQILIGDQVHLTIETPFQDGLSVTFPALADTITSQVEVVSSETDTLRPKDGQAMLRHVLTLTSFDTGFIVIPPLPVLIGTDTFATEPQLVYVADVAIDETADVKDIEEPLDPPFDWYSLLPWLIGYALLGILIPLIYYLIKKRKRQPEVALAPTPSEPAHVTALARLEALRQQKLWQSDRVKEYHIELTDILRWYLEQRFGIMALEQTTDEITYAMERQGMDRALIADMRKVLLLADLVKFAKARPISTENEQSMDMAVAFVTATIPTPVTEAKA